MNKERRKSKFALGNPPIFDPCKECITSIVCEKVCVDKIRYEDVKRRSQHIQSAKLKPKTLKKVKFERKLNGIRD